MTTLFTIQDMPFVAKNIRAELRQYLIKNGIKALVIGQSGGIDSALCSALAAPVTQELNIPLLGRSITIETNKQDEIDRGALIGDAFCSDFDAIDLTQLYKQVYGACEFDNKEVTLLEQLRMGNIKSRMRMIYLYDLAQKHGGMVLSTDNYTEYLLGYWTLHGDVGDYAMIQHLWKKEVYLLSRYLVAEELQSSKAQNALQACIDAIPTDGLGITDSDLQQIQADTYDEVDEILLSYITGSAQYEQHPVIQRHRRSAFKRKNPYNLSREAIARK